MVNAGFPALDIAASQGEWADTLTRKSAPVQIKPGAERFWHDRKNACSWFAVGGMSLDSAGRQEPVYSILPIVTLAVVACQPNPKSSLYNAPSGPCLRSSGFSKCKLVRSASESMTLSPESLFWKRSRHPCSNIRFPIRLNLPTQLRHSPHLFGKPYSKSFYIHHMHYRRQR